MSSGGSIVADFMWDGICVNVDVIPYKDTDVSYVVFFSGYRRLGATILPRRVQVFTGHKVQITIRLLADYVSP